MVGSIDYNSESSSPELVRSVEKKRGHYLITFDNNIRISMKSALYDIRPVFQDELIDISELKQWLVTQQYREALDKAVAMLAAREHSSGEIKEKLLRSGYLSDTVEMVLYKLSREKLLDDTDFAEHWAKSRSSMKYGRMRIAHELAKKGVPYEDIQYAVESVDDNDQRSNAKELARTMFKRTKKDEPSRKTAQRILAMLARRGFDWETARSAVECVMRNEREEPFEEEY